MYKKNGLQTAFVAISVLSLVVLSLVACTRSKLGSVPTAASTTSAQKAETKTPGATVVSANVTVTTTATMPSTSTVIPTMTPTPAQTQLPTATPQPGATAAPTATPQAQQPTATPTPAGGTGFEYVVVTGDTLWGLAIRFGTTVDAIKAKNSLSTDTIYKGQKLIIPGATTGGETVTHVVQPGENLFRIALKYNTTVEAVAAANNIVNPSFVYVGQKLIIVQGGTTPPSTGVRYHVVQRGESLWSIAMKYDTTPWAIANYNGIANINLVYAGRTLRIP